MTKNNKKKSWKEKNYELWKDLAETFYKIKDKPSFKLIIKFIFLIGRILLSIKVKEFIEILLEIL